ncbi:hypothetical protein [Chitinophaga sp. sic0106]|uniref:hypothetical protein n=1 Tax=Chitinophaga sp. sic0106 TaxID=2854785 RepID=UPI001C46E536|nr:hypothetical protein [Chitinophaga sp. sic0106]MBV7529278.1 hypothetical protein [Chitinophaga sp. sic0106]
MKTKAKLRKADSSYLDCYDSHTITLLQGISGESNNRDLEFDLHKTIAIQRANIKHLVVQEMMDSDEMKDLLIDKFRIPKHITCDVCGLPLRFCTYFFDMEDHPILFVFECLKGHLPRVLVDADGRRYDMPAQKCSDCGFDMTVSLEGLNDELTISHECHSCDKKIEDTVKADWTDFSQIKEEDRKEYCYSFAGQNLFFLSLFRLAEDLSQMGVEHVSG